MLAMVCSLLYQETYMYLTELELVMFFVGFFTSIGGVIAMVWKEMSGDSDRTKAWIKRLATSPGSPLVGREGREGREGRGALPVKTSTTTAHGNQIILGPERTDSKNSNSGTGKDSVDAEIRGVRRSLIPVASRGSSSSSSSSMHSSLPENIIDVNCRGPSPLTSSNGSINSAEGSPRFGCPRSGGWAPIAIPEDLVDSLSNQVMQENEKKNYSSSQ